MLIVSETKHADQAKVASIVVGLLNGAGSSVRMSTGLFPPFYEGRADVKDALTRAATRKGVKRFRILLDPSANLERLRSEVGYVFDLHDSGRLEIAQARASSPHVLVVDEKNIRIEKPHKPEEPTGENMVIQSALGEVAKVVVGEFDREWASSIPLPRRTPA